MLYRRSTTLLALALFASFGLRAQDPPPGLRVHSDLEYSRVGGRMAMDVVEPLDGTSPLPAVVLIHGGGFRAGNRQSWLKVAYQLAQNGYVAATITYRLSPQHQYPAHLEDAKAAVRYLRANAARFRIDPERIGTSGGSAGGTLALLVGLTADYAPYEGSGPNQDQSSRVQAVVNFYGATDFTKSYAPGASVDAAEVLPMFLGGDLEHSRPLHIQSSPLYWVTPDDPPVLTIHGTKDRYVGYDQAVALTERLGQAGVHTELLTLEGRDHGFGGFGDDLERAYQAMIRFFDEHLKDTPEQRTIVVADHGPRGEVLRMEWPSGRIVSRTPNNRGHDAQLLSSGNILYTTGNWARVVEVDPHGREVWSYGPAEGLQHPVAAQRLLNGNTLIADMLLGEIREVSPDKKTVWTYAHEDLGDRQMRSVRRTPSGTTLIAVERHNKVIEVDRAGKIVWSFTATGGDERFPYQAHRLANGNTLIGLASPGEVVEVSPSGDIVRSVGGGDGVYRMSWCSGLAPLPDGGFLVSDYRGRRLLEFNAQGRLVHSLATGDRTVASVSAP